MTDATEMQKRLEPMQALAGMEDTHLLINEIYASIQGESTHAGRPCTFIRTTTCNQRCRYCDTAYAFTQGSPVHIDDVVRRALGFGLKLVELTGGEPLLQPLAPELCRRLIDAGCEVLIETGGSRDISVLPEGVKVILDIKTPGSGEEHANDYANLGRLRDGAEVKFVLTSRADYDWALALIGRESLAPVLFSPAFGMLDASELAAWMTADNAPARLNLQLHKYIWPPTRRGV
jgi:7-carboxy-7-deazaguanine synthase